MADWRTDDRELLARILTAEAGNQGPVGMTAAGNVIMNRAGRTGYGEGVRGVIMKPGQFSPMNSVTGYASGEQGQNIDSLRPSDTAYMVADSLLQGTAGDITGGATHFFNPDISNPSWAQGKEFKRIGDHVFGKADAGRGTTQSAGPMTGSNQPQRTGAPMGLLDTQPAQQPEQQKSGFWNNFAGGLLADPDRRAKIGIALEGMTLNPNQGLIQNLQSGIDTRKEQAVSNRTVEYLRSQGRDDLADAVASGSLGGRDAAAILFREPKNVDQTAAMQNYQFLLAQNVDPKTAMERSFGAGGTSINIDQRSDSKFEEAFAGGDAKTIGTVYDAGLQAQRNIGRIDQLEQALAAAPAGGVGVIKQVAGEFGIATEGLGDIQAAQALINSLVPEQRQPGSGPMSDADLALFKQSLPRIINQPDGNRRIIDTMRAIAEYDRAGAAIIQRMRLPNDDQNKIDRGQAFQLLQERPNPLADFRAPSGAQGGSAAQPVVIDGVTIRKVN